MELVGQMAPVCNAARCPTWHLPRFSRYPLFPRLPLYPACDVEQNAALYFMPVFLSF